ncbi:MAG: type II secretion system protein N [Rubripirellula sp.]
MQRRCLGILAGSLLAGTVGAAAWSLRDVSTPPPVASTAGQNQGSDAIIPNQTPPRVYNDQLLNASLRGPLYPPPPAPPVKKTEPRKAVPKVTPPPAQLNMTLVGTLKDKGKGFAILEDATNKFDVKGIGETLELTPAGVQIKNIGTDEVTLLFQGRESTHKLKASNQKKAPPKGNRNNRRNNR